MAKFDIMPLKSALGGTYEVRWGQMTASEVFDVGEPVNVVDAGTITEPPDDATQWIITDGDSAIEAGIAASGPAGGAQTNDNAANKNPATGTTYATGDDVAYWPINQGIQFITDNFFAAGAGSAVAPVQTDVGESYQIAYGTFGTPDAGWGVEQTAGVVGVDFQAKVIEVLDAKKNPIRLTGQAGVYVVFTIEATDAAA